MPEKRTAPAGDRYYFSGARLRLERKRRGLSLKRLAALIGVTRPALLLIELGKRKPSLRVFERLLEVFHEDPESIVKAAAAGKEAPLERRIAVILKDQPKDRQKLLLRSLRLKPRRAPRAEIR